MCSISGLFFINFLLQLMVVSTTGETKNGGPSIVALDSNNSSVLGTIEKTSGEMTGCGFPSLDSWQLMVIQRGLPLFATSAGLPRPRGQQPESEIRKKSMQSGEKIYRRRRREVHLTAKSSSISEKHIKIGVSLRSTFKQFVEVSRDPKHITGFSIDVFEAATRLLPYNLIYEIVPFNGSHHQLLEEVARQTFDAAVGDIIIEAEGYDIVEFTQPYVDAELVMVVATKAHKSQPWLFFSAFTRGMWFIIVAMSLFTSFVVWFIENQNNTESRGSLAAQVVTALQFLLATIYGGQRESIRNNLSHFVLAPWFLLMLVVATAFTNSFTSMITSSSKFEPSITDIDVLRRTNAVVGYDGNSFTRKYLREVLRFKANNIKSMTSVDEYAQTLSSGRIRAAFFMTPFARMFLAKYCRGFTIAGPTKKLGGFGFVFRKGLPLSTDMSKSILRLRETGELHRMEEEMLSFSNCSKSASDANVPQTLGPGPFIGLFLVSGSTSAIALLIAVILVLRQNWDRITKSQAALQCASSIASLTGTIRLTWGRTINSLAEFWTLVVALFERNQTRNVIPL